MAEYVAHGGIKSRNRCTTSCATRSRRARASHPTPCGRCSTRSCGRSARATGRCSRNATRCRPRSTPGSPPAAAAASSRRNRRVLREIGYIVPVGPPFKVATANVDPEIANLAGPAARRARRQSALRAERGERALGQPLRRALRHERDSRGGRRRERPRLQPRSRRARHRAERTSFSTSRAARERQVGRGQRRSRSTAAGSCCTLAGDGRSRACRCRAVRRLPRRAGNALDERATAQPRAAHRRSPSIRSHPIGKQHPAGIKDVVLESACPTIMDCEDSVATVDAADKTVVYRNWCGIMRGTLTRIVRAKAARTMNRHLNADREYTAPDGKTPRAPGPQHAARSARRRARADGSRHGRRGPTDRRNVPRLRDDDARGAARFEGHGRRCATAARAACTSSSRSSTAPRKWRCRSSSSQPSSARSACRRIRSRSASWTRSAARPSTSKSAFASAASGSSSSTRGSSIAPATSCTRTWKRGR